MDDKQIRDEYERRDELYKAVRLNKSLEITEKELCKRSIIRWINNWCYTYDPRLPLKHLPFNLFPFQEDALLWLDERLQNKETGVIEKSRDMGASWLLSSWGLHKFIFQPGFSALYASRVEADVDNKSLDSIFGKVRYNLYKQPTFLFPPMFSKMQDGNDPDRYLMIKNPLNGNELTGSSTNDNLGRGGRKSVVILDEFAFVEHSDRVWMSVGEVSTCKILSSTPNGKGNEFARIRHGGNVPVKSLHWKQHPHKDRKWYEDKKKDMEPYQIAQELDIDYEASKSGRVYKRFNKLYHVADEVIYPNPAFEHFITWDFGIADAMTMIFGQIDYEGTVELYASYDLVGKDIEFFLPLTQGNRPFNDEWKLLGSADQLRIKKLLDKVFFERETKERLYLEFSHYGDFAGTQRTANSKRSVRERMRQDPYNINLICSSRQAHAWRIQCFDSLLKLRERRDGSLVSRFKISPDLDGVLTAIQNYVWDNEDVNAPNIKPKHDWNSHYMSSLEFLAINRFPVIQQNKSSVEKVR